MADGSITLNTGTGGSIIDTRTTSDGTPQHRQVVVIGEGAATSDAIVPADANGLQVKQPTAANLNATVVGTGTFAVQAAPAVVAPSATVLQNAAVANGNGTNLNVAGFATAILNVTASVAMSGGTTINFEASVDDTTFVPIFGALLGANTIAVTTLTTGDFQLNVAGYKSIRARISAYSAGTITVKGYPTTLGDMQPVVNANIVADLSNKSTNVAQLAGTTTDTNSGTKSAGTLRVVLATDQPALTNKLLVTPDSVALPANQSVNCAQVAGTTTDTNSGTKSAGTLRVVLATDQPQLTNKLLVTPDANSAINVAQVAGGTAITGGVTGSVAVGGNVAHGATNSGNPSYAGAEAIAHGTNPTAVTAGQRTKLYANRAGVPFVIGGHPNIVTIEAAYTAAQTDTAIVTIATGLKIVVTQVQVVCDNANTVNVGVRVGFGTANTPTTTGVVLTHPGIPAGSGVSRGDGSGILGVGADDADLRITCTVPTTGSVRVLVSYHTIES